MAYKNKADQVAASRKHYEANSERVKTRAKEFLRLARDRNRAYVNEIKAGPCTDCGQTFRPVAMQFDHISDDKEFDVAKAVYGGYSLARIQAEIDKCELVCANCHAVRTEDRHHSLTGKAPIL